MAGPTIDFSEKRRFRVAKFLGICHWMCILPSFICLITALFIQVSIEDKVAFIENYNGAVLPGFLVFTGFYGFVSHTVCGKIIFTNRLEGKRKKWGRLLFPAVIATAIIFLAEFISGIMCFVHIGELEDSFDDGIIKAIAAYKGDLVTKENVDVLQMSYTCCGSKSHTDWFKVSWVHPDYLERGQPPQGEDVPFSCCDPASMRPCIRTRVQDNTVHFNYDYNTHHTLYKRGCVPALMEYYENSILRLAGWMVLVLSFVQIGTCIMGRFLQTAIATSLTSGDTSAPSTGFLLGPPANTVAASAGGAADTTLETTTDGETLLDTTEETEEDGDDFDDDGARYTDLAFPEPPGGGEPFYENVPPFEISNEFVDDEHIYNEGEVEDYLASKFAASKTRFEPVALQDDGGDDDDDDDDGYEKMNMSNSSVGPDVRGRYYKSWNCSPTRRHSGERVGIYRKPYPSTSSYSTFQQRRSPLVINMAEGFSPIAKPPRFARPRTSSPVRRKSSPTRRRMTSPTPPIKPPKPPKPKYREPKSRQYRMSPEREYLLPRESDYIIPTERGYHIAPDRRQSLPELQRDRSCDNNQSRMSIQGIQVGKDGRRSPDRKRSRSPQKHVSPSKTSFRSGVSFNCNHALE